MSIETSDIGRAVNEGNVGIVEKLLKEDPQLALTRDSDNRLPLHWAVSFQNVELTKILLNPSQFNKDRNLTKIEIDIDECTDDSDWTPLHIAAATGNLEIVQILTTHNPNPDINQQTSTGQTCLHYAVSKNHFDVVEYLINEMHASVRIKDSKGQLPIHRAAGIGSEKMIQMLVESGKSQLNLLDSFGLSALHHALAEGHGDAAVQLVKYGADWKQLTSSGDNCLEIALNDKVRAFFEKCLIDEGLVEK